jgi:hypothetical protein
MTVTVWRGWALWPEDGILRSPVTPNATGTTGAQMFYMLTGIPPMPPWPGGEWSAWCKDQSHPAPAENCGCGAYGVSDLSELLGYRATTGRTWDDERHVVGQVELSGRVLHGGTSHDPPSTMRGESGRVAGRVYFARPL